MKLSFGVDSPQYCCLDGYLHEMNAWAVRALDDKGFDTFRVDIVAEGALRVHRYRRPLRVVDGEVESYTEVIVPREMPNPAWFDR